MPSWSAGQYLTFAEERTRPCRDLAAHVSLGHVSRIVDLGCGPGNSTEVLAERWPSAEITGVDNSPEMIDAAGRAHPEYRWRLLDIAEWAREDNGQFDLVFSNAALQWVPDHELIYPRLWMRVAPAGALAIQLPGNFDAPPHRAMREIAASVHWRSAFGPDGVREWHVHDLDFYYDLMAPHAAQVDLWATEYMHVLPSSDAILEWYKGTGLRPFLDALECDADRDRFIRHYRERICWYYRPRPDGRVLFPFRRIFLIAYRAPI